MSEKHSLTVPFVREDPPVAPRPWNRPATGAVAHRGAGGPLCSGTCPQNRFTLWVIAPRRFVRPFIAPSRVAVKVLAQESSYLGEFGYPLQTAPLRDTPLLAGKRSFEGQRP